MTSIEKEDQEWSAKSSDFGAAQPGNVFSDVRRRRLLNNQHRKRSDYVSKAT